MIESSQIAQPHYSHISCYTVEGIRRVNTMSRKSMTFMGLRSKLTTAITVISVHTMTFNH